jgi:SAM-dependent methyltransferase
MASRKIKWRSGIDKVYAQEITVLENKLKVFYVDNPDYYGEIDFTSRNWINENETGYRTIFEYAGSSVSICEFGCGNANILKHYPELQSRYSGCDFSATLLKKNQQNYPRADFKQIIKPNDLPFADEQFDLVFSVFVIEHSTDPAKLLSECNRILQPGGRLIILCPDFLGTGRMSSQRSGFSQGNTIQKIRKKQYMDAIVTFIDNRMLIPLQCYLYRLRAKLKPLFLINIRPTVFEDDFTPDVDAVYVTYKDEMIRFLNNNFSVIGNSEREKKYEKSSRLIFLKMRKDMPDNKSHI